MATATLETPATLTVCYDEQCALCRRCREWLEGQRTNVNVEFVAAGSAEAQERFGDVPWLGADLVVVDECGNLWAGSAAFLMCLWATNEYRGWSYRLSRRGLAPLAERFFHFVSSNRRHIGKVVGSKDCPDGRCGHRGAAPRKQEPVPHLWPQAETYAPPVTACAHCGAAVYETARQCWLCGTLR